MSLSSAYKTDSKKETEGVQIKMPANEDGSIPFFVVSRTSRTNERYTKALERIMRPVQAKIRTKTLKNKEADTLLIQAFVEGALLGWGNILKADVTGNDADEGFADFNKENAAALFARLPDLYDDVQAQASDVSLFREGAQEESAKN